MTVVAALLALAAPGSAQGFVRFPLFEQAATQVAGRPVEVRCAYADEWAADSHPAANAYTRWPVGGSPMYVVLSPRSCFALILLAVAPNGGAAWAMNPWLGWPDAAGAGLLTLAHESVHMRGVRDEHTAECDGLAAVPAAATTFGANAGTVAMLAAAARRDNIGRGGVYVC